MKRTQAANFETYHAMHNGHAGGSQGAPEHPSAATRLEQASFPSAFESTGGVYLSSRSSKPGFKMSQSPFDGYMQPKCEHVVDRNLTTKPVDTFSRSE